jgi:hypothetical protein
MLVDNRPGYLPASKSFQSMIALKPIANVPWVCHRQ